MSEETKDTTIETYKGDTCSVTFGGLEEGLVIYFSVRDTKNNELVFEEIRGVVDDEGTITFVLTPELTNKFYVQQATGVNYYYYGLKQVDEETGEENTILVGDSDNPRFGERYVLRVFQKQAEGIQE